MLFRSVVNWFLKTSGIPDEKGRAGNHPGRVEAEALQLDGYAPVAVTPWEAASGATAVTCPAARCTARYVYQGEPGWRELRIRYFDQNNGTASYSVLLNGEALDAWTAADRVPTQKIDSSSSSLRTLPRVSLRRGDELRIEGTPNGGESAALDYIEIR